MPWYLLLIIISFGLHLIGMIIIACNERDIEDYNVFGRVLWVLFGIFIIPLIYLPCLLACLTHKEEK